MRSRLLFFFSSFHFESINFNILLLLPMFVSHVLPPTDLLRIVEAFGTLKSGRAQFNTSIGWPTVNSFPMKVLFWH